MEKGELLYSSPRGISFPTLVISILMMLPLFIFGTLVFSSLNFNVLFLIVFVLVLLFMVLLTIGLYIGLTGYDLEIYESLITITTGRLFKQKGQSDPVTIDTADIKRILFVNNMLHIYWYDRSQDKMIRNFTNMGFGQKKRGIQVVEILNDKGSYPHWMGPSVYNEPDRMKEQISYRKMGWTFLGIVVIPPVFITLPFLVLNLIYGEPSSSFIVGLFLMALLPSSTLGIFFLPWKVLERKSYLHHGETFSIQGGFMMAGITEYFFEDIVQIERKKAIPLFSSLNPFTYKYFENPFSSKVCDDIFRIKFKDGYRIFEMGEYIEIRKEHPRQSKKLQYLTVPAHIIDIFRQKGANI